MAAEDSPLKRLVREAEAAAEPVSGTHISGDQWQAAEIAWGKVVRHLVMHDAAEEKQALLRLAKEERERAERAAKEEWERAERVAKEERERAEREAALALLPPEEAARIRLGLPSTGATTAAAAGASASGAFASAEVKNPHARLRQNGGASSRSTFPHHEQTVECNGFLNHMPGQLTCASVRLYCGAFSIFKHELRGAPDADDLVAAHDLATKLSQHYHGKTGEAQLNRNFNNSLAEYLRTTFPQGAVKQDFVRVDSAEAADIVVLRTADLSSAVAVGEIKRLNSVGCDPLHQACCYYEALSDYDASSGVVPMRPMLLLVVVGPILLVFGAIRDTSGFVCVDPLASTMVVDYDDDDFDSTARVLRAFRLAAADLGRWYDQRPSLAAQASCPLFTVLPSPHDAVPLADWTSIVGVSPRKPRVLGANLGDRAVVVKFLRHDYPGAAHEYMHSLGAAPELLFYGRSGVSGWNVVVMDFIEPDFLGPKLEPAVAVALDTALEDFHQRGWVHGDLRRANVVVRQGTAFVIDFDWAGKEGEARYPALINTNYIGQQWHHEVQAGGLITAVHDRAALGTFMEHSSKRLVSSEAGEGGGNKRARLEM